MAQFYATYSESENLVPLVREIPWTHNTIILKRIKTHPERSYYLERCCSEKWSKAQLIREIENKAHLNFQHAQISFSENAMLKSLNLKDKYLFDFLQLQANHSERELERGLINNVQKFLLEMGNQFSFIGSQFKLELAGNEYFIDLLLFHRTLQCLIAIELKVGEFMPEYKGKMEFYLALLNDTVRLPHENDSVGIIICKSKNRTIVEYSLKKSNYPIGVSSYFTSTELPKELTSQLPSLDAIRKSLTSE